MGEQRQVKVRAAFTRTAAVKAVRQCAQWFDYGSKFKFRSKIVQIYLLAIILLIVFIAEFCCLVIYNLNTMKTKIPDRWEAYSNMGQRVPLTRFICFKVPLDGGNSTFSTKDLLNYCPTLGMVIDLTNTKKYYKPGPLADLNIEYQKIFTEGHVIPNKKVIKEFFDATNQYLEKNSDNDKLVGVHCTHGLNRTGYLVCR